MMKIQSRAKKANSKLNNKVSLNKHQKTRTKKRNKMLHKRQIIQQKSRQRKRKIEKGPKLLKRLSMTSKYKIRNLA